MKELRRTTFGDPLLRRPTRHLSAAEITTPATQELISSMRHLLATKAHGVGLAAPQVGQGVAISVIWIRPTPSRPKNEEIKLVVINPEVIKTYGARTQMWEGCISFGTSSRDFPYAKALRWRKIRVRYLDETGKRHERDVNGMLAHVLQHEIDHLNGVLFVDRVKDSKTFMMMSEFKKHILPTLQHKTKK